MKSKIRNLLLLCTLHFALLTDSQSQVIEWQNTIGGASEDWLMSIQQTADKGFILGGWSSSNISGVKSEDSFGTWDYWVVKTDSSGNIQWQNTIGGDGMDYLRSIQQTSDGGYILGGYSSSNISVDKTENCFGLWDYWIVKTDISGNIQWQNTIGGNAFDQLYSIQQTSDGGYILGGSSNSNISGNKTENSNGNHDYWIVKTDASGNIQWQNTIGGNSNDVLYSLQQTVDGGYILGGASGSDISGDKTENSFGTWDYWIVKTDASGNIQWQNTIGGSLYDYVQRIQQTTDGGFIVGGYSLSNISGNKTENCLGQYDYWIVKIDTTGNIQWQNTIGGNNYDNLYSIQQSVDGGYLLGGRSNSSISGDKTENSIGDFDNWIVKTDAWGNIEWQNTIGGSGTDLYGSVLQTSDNGYFLGGSSDSNISGDKTENSYGDVDYWILKLTDQYNSITGTLFADFNNNGIHETGEPVLSDQKLTEQNTGRIAFSEPNGNYSLFVLDTGNFEVNADAISYYNSVPVTHSAYFSGMLQTDSLNDFAFQAQGMYNDICVNIAPLGPFRSGFNASYLISYENVGTTTITPTIIFFPYNNITYVSASITPASVAPDSVVWNLPALTPFQSGSIVVNVNVNLGLPIGTLINSSVQIEPVAGDANPACNYHSWEVLTIGSFDPNDILVNEDTITTTQLVSQPFLEYIIRFQNTGNDTAFTVKILNPIDTNKLELNSIELVYASHPIHISWLDWKNNMEFKFENILLPDSNINEPLSHGFVHYRIQPKTSLLAGDNIFNNAAIYFDFNTPVLTNTAITKIVLPPVIEDSTVINTRLQVYPNPATKEITISGYTLTNGKATIKVIDVLGNEVYSSTVTTETWKLNTEHLASGVYFVQTGNANAKFVKQ